MSSDSARDVADRLHSAAIHLLRTLRKVDEASGLTASRLSALSVLVRGLERDGLVARETLAEDARAVRVRATARGRRILERGRERRVAEFVRLLSGRPATELETLGAAADILEGLLAPARRPS